MNNEELIEEIHILAKKIIHYNNCMITYYCLTYVKKKSYCDHILQYCVIQTNNPQMLALRNSNSQLIHDMINYSQYLYIDSLLLLKFFPTLTKEFLQ